MRKIEAIIRPERLEQVKVALTEGGFAGLHVENVVGRGELREMIHSGRGGDSYEIDMLPKVKMTIVVREDQTEQAVQLIIEQARTGNLGDGIIFVSAVEDAIRVLTGERGSSALS